MIRCREIGRADLAAVADLLTRGFEGRSRDYWMEGLRRTSVREVPEGLSGSSAIAGFRPHRTHRAALPQWALQKGPEAGRSSPPCLVDHRFRKREGDQEPAVIRPVHAAFLATFAEHLTPVLDDACLEHAQ